MNKPGLVLKHVTVIFVSCTELGNSACNVASHPLDNQ